jgi:ubiquinone biosynthesis protein UbiJ
MNDIASPTLHAALVAGLEAALNRALKFAPATSRELAGLAGTTIAVDCTAPALQLVLQPTTDGRILLSGSGIERADTVIRGALSDFSSLARSPDPAAELVNGDLELIGDSAPLLQLRDILGRIDIDWEAPLVEALGDVPGHTLAQGLRQFFSWSRDAGSSLERQLREFIHEEARLTPPRLEVEDFYRDVDNLALAMDRLEARLALVRERTDRLDD